MSWYAQRGEFMTPPGSRAWTATIRLGVCLLAVLVTCLPCGLPSRAQQSVAPPGQSPVASDDQATQQAARAKRERLLEIYTGEAEGYSIYRDASRKEKVELRREPVYVWTNPVRGGGQDGAVYVWTCRGRAEVLGSFFSYPANGPRRLSHEFHSLSLSVLDVERSEGRTSTWRPMAAGIEIAPIPGAPGPGSSAAQRLSQVRTLAHDFSASTKDQQDRTWELRLLPQPLYRNESTDPDLSDGALFAFVTSAGTDPEALLMIEARKPAHSDGPVWHYGIARFTDQQLRVRHKGKEVFSAPMILYNEPLQDPKDRYRAFTVRNIPTVEGKAQR
jgi:hypothetical protein